MPGMSSFSIVTFDCHRPGLDHALVGARFAHLLRDLGRRRVFLVDLGRFVARAERKAARRYKQDHVS